MRPIPHSLLRVRQLFFLLTHGIMLLTLTGLGCETAYYGTMEKLGYHKRDLLVRDVTKARDAQQDAKEQFKSALDRFTKTLEIQGGELQEKYEALNSEYGLRQWRTCLKRYFANGMPNLRNIPARLCARRARSS
jgi:hypothetical protein